MSIRRYPYLLLCLTLVGITVALLSEAGEPKILHIGFPYESRPFSYLHNGEPQGLHVSLIKAAAIAAGYQPRVHVMALQRVLHRLQMGELDIGSIFVLANSPFGKHAKNTLLSERPYVRVDVCVYARAESKIRLDSFTDALNYQLGQHQVASFYNHPEFPNSDPVHFFRNYQTLFTALDRGRIDVAVADELSAAYVLQEGRSQGAIEPIFYVGSGGEHLIASELALGDSSRAVLQQLYLALQELERDGTLERLLREYSLEPMMNLYLPADAAD